ncbi:MAG: hypothetical protein IKB31_07465 [Bacteroidaceae bacterium]|nr:hypothetical protein [Bacteroidaceae bacterium]MBR3896124.1 hypothetical protein [Bacteroidaceae bacterium]
MFNQRNQYTMLLDRSQIEQWADTYNAKGDFPLLIQKLVYGSTPELTKCDIPFGSAVNMGGFDGEVETVRGTAYIPQGKCILEFGTNKDFKTKAERDYTTRSSNNYEGLNKSETTFIFMTPRCWGNKKDWEEEKKKDGIWKDVRVYDSTLLVQWILSVPSVDIWFSQLVGMPANNLISGSDLLKELLEWDGIKLDASFYTAGREDIALQLKDLLTSPTIRAYRASSKEEALAFILAAGKLFPENEQKDFYAKTIVVDDKAAFRQMGVQQGMINLVPDFDNPSVLFQAVANGKIVLVPLGPGDDFNLEVVELPSPDRFRLESALVKSGIEEEKAKRLVKDCSCNLTMIKKALGFPIFRVDWLYNDDVIELVPALIVERWNENCDGDKEVMASLSKMEYNDFQTLMARWSQKPVPPVMSVGALWRITSPLSLWSDMSRLIRKEHINELKALSVKVLSCEDDTYSHQLKQGLLNSLIILAWHGNQILKVEYSLQKEVDNVLRQVVSGASACRWNNMAKVLPLIAESSPSVFLEEVKRSLMEENSAVMSMFNEKEGIIAPESNHPYLLWALESLAWLPESLKDVTEILLMLSEKDPGGRLSNRPFNSLVDIFLPWLPHTTATIDQRLSIIDVVLRCDYSKNWDFLISLLPKRHAVSSGTHQLKWRGYDMVVPKGAAYVDIWKITEFACEKLMAVYDGDDHRLAELIDKIEPIPLVLRQKLINWIKETVASLRGQYPETRKELRETLWYQNIIKADDDLRMTETEISDMKMAYEYLSPANIIEKNKWLFDEMSPRLLEEKKGENEKDLHYNMKILDKMRGDAVKEWLDNLTIDDVLEIRKSVKEPFEYGRSLGCFYETDGLTEKVLTLLGNQDDKLFTNGYIRGYEGALGEEKLINYFDGMHYELSEEEASVFLLDMWPSPVLFDYIETLPKRIQTRYWTNYRGGTYGPYSEMTLLVLNKLRLVGRSLDAMNGSWHYCKELPTSMLQNLLWECLSCSLDVNEKIDMLALESYMEELHKRPDADKEILFKLEWLFVPFISHHSSKSNVSLIYEKMTEEPQLFVELLTYLYRPEHETEEVINHVETEEDATIKKNNALRAFYLLREWNTIPGIDKDGNIDLAYLKEWTVRAVELAKEKDRERFAYHQIGGLFAKYPEDVRNWPPMELFGLMEELNSEELFHNYNIGLFNKRGFTSRGGYDGGDIERSNAEYFDDLRKKCQLLYPHVAKVFGDLSEQYKGIAKEMDDQATIAKLDY